MCTSANYTSSNCLAIMLVLMPALPYCSCVLCHDGHIFLLHLVGPLNIHSAFRCSVHQSPSSLLHHTLQSSKLTLAKVFIEAWRLI